MEQNNEKLKTNSKEIVRNEKGQLAKGVVLNPNGRPKGSEDFKTKFYKVIDKLAKQNNLTPDEIEEQLILVGYKKAKDGDYQFYKDLHDRIHGKAPQTLDINDNQKTNNTYNFILDKELQEEVKAIEAKIKSKLLQKHD